MSNVNKYSANIKNFSRRNARILDKMANKMSLDDSCYLNKLSNEEVNWYEKKTITNYYKFSYNQMKNLGKRYRQVSVFSDKA